MGSNRKVTAHTGALLLRAMLREDTMNIEFLNTHPSDSETQMLKGPYEKVWVMLEYLRDGEGNVIAAWNNDRLRWVVYTKGTLHYFTDFLITNEDN